MQNDRDRLIELIRKQRKFCNNENCGGCGYAKFGGFPDCQNKMLAHQLTENGVIVPPVEVGGEIWVIDREDGEAVDISCVRFLAKSKGCIIATSWINDYDLDETLEYHINETQNNFDTDLKVYPDEDCFLTKEEAEQALKERESSEC